MQLAKNNNEEENSKDTEKEKAEEAAKEKRRLETLAANLTQIAHAQDEATDTKIADYNAEFQGVAVDNLVVLAEVDTAELHEENQQLLVVQEAQKQAEKQFHAELRRDVHRIQEESTAELYHRSELMRKQLVRSEHDSVEKTQRRSTQTKIGFRQVGFTLDSYLAQSKKEAQGIYRDIAVGTSHERHNLAGSQASASSSSSWTQSKQQIEVRIEVLRCVKDKLPKGRYSILCTVIDRVGGRMLDYQTHSSRFGRRITTPKLHNGEYHLNNLRFEESLLITAPSRSSVKPAMALLFELFLLKSKEYLYDQVLGWGVFPLIDCDFELNKGKFKVSNRSHI